MSKKNYPKEATFKVITPAVFILNLVTSNPAMYLHKFQAAVQEFLLIDVHISIGHLNGFTRQKLCYVTLQRDAYERAQYVSDINMLP